MAFEELARELQGLTWERVEEEERVPEGNYFGQIVEIDGGKTPNGVPYVEFSFSLTTDAVRGRRVRGRYFLSPQAARFLRRDLLAAGVSAAGDVVETIRRLASWTGPIRVEHERGTDGQVFVRARFGHATAAVTPAPVPPDAPAQPSATPAAAKGEQLSLFDPLSLFKA